MQNGVMRQLDEPGLRAYVVWVPMFRGMERDVPKATTELPDSRARHYWDGDSQLVKAYREVLDFNEPAWDIFVLYGPDVRWDGDPPPEPEFWMHQLGSPNRPRVDGPYLDAAVFLDRTRTVLANR